jgi:DNA polymerase-3 subunit gamma/tau
MTYQALARKYRPQTFSDILGQDSIVRTLQNAIEQNRIHQAYLFSGVRGVGKTTAARILAKALNCANGPTTEPCNACSICSEITDGIDLDVREIDAATYTQVDNVRELREVTQFQPARDRRRIFIIDEAHMLSTAAWNALLKIIEEPPPHVVFIMATTEMHKVPATILSRVQQFVFRKITPAEVAARLEEICRKEGIEAEREALDVIARRGEGSVRDSLSLLDQIVAFSGRTLAATDVATILGLSDTRVFTRIVEAIRDGDASAILDVVEEASQSGRDFKLLYRDLLAYLRTILLVNAGADESLLLLEPEERKVVRKLGESLAYDETLRVLSLLLKDDEIVSRSEQQRLAVEVALLKAATFPRMRAIEQILAGGGEPVAAPRAAPPRARAEAPEARRAAAKEPAAEPEPPDAGNFAERFVARVRREKKVLAGYLEQARKIRQEGDDVVLEFEASQTFEVDYLKGDDQIAFLSAAAQELLGRPANLKIVAREAAESAKPQNPAAADPVLQSLAKHLGGEVVAPKGRKRSMEGR